MYKNTEAANHFMTLPLGRNVQFTYVWVGGNNELRGKTRTLINNSGYSNENHFSSVENLPDWDFDGSSTGQAVGRNSEVLLKPKALFKNPFTPGGFLVMCDTYCPDGSPHPTNHRFHAMELFNQKLEEEPWYGFEQEFFLMKPGTKTPLGFPETGHPRPQGPYYCSVGTSNCVGREILDSFYRAALYAGIKVSGTNVEVAPSQFEFQIGPCIGIEEGDHLFMARYILCRVAEHFNCDVNFEPKPVKGNWNGSGGHLNISTLEMREDNGLKHILKAVEKLGKCHEEMVNVYGDEDNKERLSGEHETSDWRTFTWGYADRGATIRVGRMTQRENKGYFELRATSSNCDPYLVTSKVFEVICLREDLVGMVAPPNSPVGMVAPPNSPVV